ncbi:glycosyl transferase 2 family protein [Candidatus Endolissoclinum faulkneri L2]|uniref:Glycosyl transferase 2 family protein n=1 Tax=Candidatus Endolissoclinum faulkneri L2 TaxID=1193729 RepID=K7YP70_9PROT|nr:glycosyltransferase family 2 protein [Candidatus Endolissoclinum faulkneri]AFX98379.1 glycosyl transferase 2 family protein [Candidatus Endolissoclinum faulkneri L2]
MLLSKYTVALILQEAKILISQFVFQTTYILTAKNKCKGKYACGDVCELTDNSPTIVLRSNKNRMPAGWVKLTYNLENEKNFFIQYLVADDGSSMTKINCKNLFVDCSKTYVTCFVRLPDKVLNLCIISLNGKDYFLKTAIRAREISRMELLLVLAYRAYSCHSIRTIIQKLQRGNILGLKKYLIKKLLTPNVTYSAWRSTFYSLTNSEKNAILAHILRMKNKPIFSIIMPTYDTPPALLKKAINSVKAQLYETWELCIADDASKNPEIRSILKQYAAGDRRIKITFREFNGNISVASNSALALATAEWIVLLDHDDELTIDALYRIAASLEDDSEADIIYSDEDKIDENGQVFDPYFKPEWSPELFLSQNMINHLVAYRRSLVQKAGQFRKGFEGSQDYDMAFRVLELTNPNRIRHIPIVLYHWRAITGSVALNCYAKPHHCKAARKAIMEHMERCGIKAKVIPGIDGLSHRVVPALPTQKPHISIIVLTRDRVDMMRVLIEGLLNKTSYKNWDLIIVNNKSKQESTLRYLAEIKKDTRITILQNEEPFNFSRLNNLAVSKSSGPLILLLNNDVEPINKEWLEEMIRQIQLPDIGAVGAKLYYPDDTIQHIGVTTGIGGVAGHFNKHLPRAAPGYFNRAQIIHNVTAVTGACLLTTHSIYKQIGGMNEKNLKVAFNDVDLCLKIRDAGYRILVTPYAELYHHESASRGFEDNIKKQKRFCSEKQWMQNQWGKILDYDPYFNPNLSLDNETPTWAFPPRTIKPWIAVDRKNS